MPLDDITTFLLTGLSLPKVTPRERGSSLVRYYVQFIRIKGICTFRDKPLYREKSGYGSNKGSKKDFSCTIKPLQELRWEKPLRLYTIGARKGRGESAGGRKPGLTANDDHIDRMMSELLSGCFCTQGQSRLQVERGRMIASTPLRSPTWSGKKIARAVSALGKGKAEIEKRGTPTIRDGTRRVASQRVCQATAPP